jgi:hypothetical protein
MKYIMIETTPQNDSERRFIPVIFPKELVHSEVAKAIGLVLARQGIGPSCIRSAGEVTFPISPGDVVCDGGNETLRVTSHIDDTDIVRLIDYHHGLAESVDMTCVIVDKAMREAKP